MAGYFTGNGITAADNAARSTATRTTAAAVATAAASFTKSKRTCPSRWGGFCWVLLVLCNFLQHLQFDYVDFHSYTYMLGVVYK